MLRLFEGHVKATTRTSNGKWFLIYLKEYHKPIAFQTIQEIPPVKSKISVEAKEDKYWIFSKHRSVVIIEPPEPYYPVQDLPNNGRTALVAEIIMNTFQWKTQVCADDIFDDCMKAVGNYIDPDTGHWHIDPRFLGHGFNYLALHGYIHPVGEKRSKRTDANHSRKICVWELTLKR